MKNRLLLILTFCFLTFLCTIHRIEAQAVAANEFLLLGAKADTLLNDAIHYKEHVGLTSGIYADGKITWTGGAGYRDQKSKIPADADMISRIASISKSMTAVAIIQLVEKGTVNLDASLQTYVPEYPKKPQGEITIRQLLTHTSVEKKKQSVVNKSLFYKVSKKGQLKKDINSNLSMKVPGGGIQSTAGDLLRTCFVSLWQLFGFFFSNYL